MCCKYRKHCMDKSDDWKNPWLKFAFAGNIRAWVAKLIFSKSLIIHHNKGAFEHKIACAFGYPAETSSATKNYNRFFLHA